MYVLSMSEHAHVYAYVHGGQKRVLDLELELQMVASCLA